MTRRAVVVILATIMLRRFATALLTLAIALAAVASVPCSSGAFCATLTAPQMDCCKGPPSGISAARCCNGTQQVRHVPSPATSERPLQRAFAAPAMQALTMDFARLQPPQLIALQRIAPTAAPPGGTLIDQHTSLLL